MQWDPQQYLRYADERLRPALDLMARVPADAPKTVVDLGCGAGNLTLLLAQRWPGASVVGIDSSAEMVAAAPDSGDVEFVVGDIRDWPARVSSPEQAIDVLVSNAALQWVPGHLDLLGGLVETVAPGGWFALQVPATSRSRATRSGASWPRRRRTPGTRRMSRPRTPTTRRPTSVS